MSDAKYAALKADEAAAKAVEDKVTEDALARSERLFKQFKQYESELSATLKEAGRTDDPYRASLPDDYKDPTESSTEPSKAETTPSTEASTEPSKAETTPSTEASTEPSKEETKPSTESSIEPSKAETKPSTESSTEPSKVETTPSTESSTEPSKEETKPSTESSTEPSKAETTPSTEASTEPSKEETKPSTESSIEPSKAETKPSTESSTEPSKEGTTPSSTTTVVPTNSNSVSTVGRPVLPTNSYILVDQATGIVLQNPDFAQGGYSLLVEVLKDVKELAGKDYKAYNIQLSNQNNPVHQISPTVVTIPVNSQKEVEAVYGIGENGQLESFQFQLNEDKSAVTFTTSHFSTYGVVYKSLAKIEEKKGEKKLPSTGQSISIATMVGGVLLIVFGFGYYIEKRRTH